MDSEKQKVSWEADTVVPELVDRLEYREEQLEFLQTEVERLRRERDHLETDLLIAERWVAALAKELELADAQLKEARPLQARLGAPRMPID